MLRYFLSVLIATLLSANAPAQALVAVSDTMIIKSENDSEIRGEVKWGYKNSQGSWAVPPVYDYAGPFSEGMAPVGIYEPNKGWKYGYVNEQGKLAINLMYDAIGKFSEGLAYVAILNIAWVDKPEENKYHKIGYIDKTNTLVLLLPSELSKPNGTCYYKGEPYSAGFARLKKSDKTCGGLDPVILSRNGDVQIVKE